MMDRGGKNKRKSGLFLIPMGILPHEGQPLTSHICQSFAVSFSNMGGGKSILG